MNESVFRLKDIFIYGFGLLTVFSFLWGSFVFYKKAIESHLEDLNVLDAVVMSAFWAFIIGRVVFALLNLDTFGAHLPRIFLITDYPGIDRWGAVLGIALGILFIVRRVKARFLDWFDLTSLGILSGEAIFLAGLFVLTRALPYLILSLLNLAVFVLLWNIEDKYRTYGWYRGKRNSARSGLITGFSLSFWGLTFLIQQVIFKEVSPISLTWAFGLLVGGLVLVYIRSGRTIQDDINNIFKTKHGRKQN